MQINVTNDVLYIFLSGVSVQESLVISENIELQTADTSHLDLDTALSACAGSDDICVVTAFIPRITAQFKITASTRKELAGIAWNASWDVLLLSAFLNTEIGFNLQSDTSASEISSSSILRATNHHFRGLINSTPHLITPDESEWVTAHLSDARHLLDDDRYQTAIHCLASYRWHTMPRIKMAILWAGIEGLFGASTEIRFRISLYISRFLYPDDQETRKTVFDKLKKLYNIRSAAVHGSDLKENIVTAEEESADILRELLCRCAEVKSLPNENELVP